MIFEALSSLKEPNGSDTSTIVSFIEVGWIKCILIFVNFLYVITNFLPWEKRDLVWKISFHFLVSAKSIFKIMNKKCIYVDYFS